MKLTITVYTDDLGMNCSAGIVVPNVFIEAFYPMRITDDNYMARATGETLLNSSAMLRKVKLRENAAAIIAKDLADHLVRVMEKYDTYNGYPIIKATNGDCPNVDAD
jgi:hypothetical protein